MSEDSLSIIIKKDGSMWCAHADNFVDLQVSPAGFGTTPELAVSDYLVQKQREICWHCEHCHQCDRDTFSCNNILKGELVIVKPSRLCCENWSERRW